MRRPLILAALALATAAQAQNPAADAARTAAPLPNGSDVPTPPPSAQLEPAPPPVDHRALEPQPLAPDELDDALLDGRRRPGARRVELPAPVVQSNPGAVPAPAADSFPTAEVALPDRWRLITAFCPDALYRGVQATCRSALDPYHQNVLKGDRPLDPAKWPLIEGHDWFVVLSGVSDTVVEPRSFPLPVGVQTSERPDSNDAFGRAHSLLVAQTTSFGIALIKGQTAYKPPEVEYRLTLAHAYSYADVSERRILDVASSKRSRRSDTFLGVQEAFVDYHIRNVSDRYDFDSVRVGIQPFQADFRGFLFQDNALGLRLFGNRDNNRWQYNLAAFWRLEKDTNSGLNDVTQRPRRDWLLLANLYRQDALVPGLTLQGTLVWNRNRERGDVEIDKNGFPVRPALIGTLRGRDYDVVYLGLNGDGHVGRLNLTTSAYALLGRDRANIFTGRTARVRAVFAAAEPSLDFDWVRLRLSALYASGDRDPYDRTETGYDAILENPIFAGADTSYWIRQSIPFVGGARAVGINGRNGVLADLRSSKDQGQSNFVNPGTVLAGAGADFDLTPELRVSTNANHLAFVTTAPLRALRNEGSIPQAIGWDLSASAIWRPRATQNLVFRLSGAMLAAGRGFRDLFAQAGGSRNFYSIVANAVLSY